jgi:hypothetical protein
MLIRAHHAFGDGLAMLDAFNGITTPRPTLGPSPARARAAASDGRGDGNRLRGRNALKRAGHLARGMLSLAPPSPLSARRSGGLPARHAFATLPAAEVRAVARAAGVSTSDLLVTVVAESVHRFLAERGTPAPHGTVRAMVPRILRSSATVDGPGNRTVALRVDLPAGPLPAAERLRRVEAAIATALNQGQLTASAAVLRLAARLPVRLQRRVAAWLYRSTWFDLIVSVIPGPRSTRWFTSARVEEAYAVLPLAEGVGLAVGILSWEPALTVAVSYDRILLPDGARLADLVRPAFAALEVRT